MIEITKTEAEGLCIIKPKVFHDNRGYFVETYNFNELKKHGLQHVFVQDNQSFSKRGVLRGLHFQTSPYAQTKLVRVIQGKILDVAVDLRRDSKTFKKSFSTELSDENGLQFLIPKGFAHAFVVLSDTALVSYKCDDFYAPKNDGGLLYSDPELNIDWKLPADQLIVSDKDKKLPTLKEYLARG